MAITFPRELLSDQMIRKCDFRLVDGTALNRMLNNRAVSAFEQYDPFFLVTFETRNLYPFERRQWSAWKNSLRSGMKSFYAYDVSRAFPIAYPNGVPAIIANTWDGEGALTTLNPYDMVVTGVPSGFKSSAGDHVGLVEGGKYGVFEVTEDATAGATLALSFAPHAPSTVFTTAATVVLYRPKAEFILDHETWEDHGDIDFSPITFQAMQRM